MRKLCSAVALTFALLAVAAGTSSAQDVSQDVLDEGSSLFKGLGLCQACHGPEAKGIPNLGADLTDGDWLHSDGSLEGTLQTIKDGVTGDKSSSGTLMPPKGGSSLSEDQLRTVAAYVWSLSHKP